MRTDGRSSFIKRCFIGNYGEGLFDNSRLDAR